MNGTDSRDICLILWVVVFFVTGCAVTPPEEMSPLKPTYDAMMENVVLAGRAGTPFLGDLSRMAATVERARRSGLWMSRKLTRVTHPKARVRLKRFDDPSMEGAVLGRKAGESFSSKMSRMISVAESERRINVQVTRRPARAFFSDLVREDPNINMIVHPGVSGKISLELKGVSVGEVVEIACEMYQFDCRPFVGSTPGAAHGYKIFPWQLIARTYRVDFLPVVRRGRSETVVSSGSRKESIAVGFGQNKNSSITNSTHAGSSVETTYKSNFWDDLEKTVRSILQLDLAVSSIREHVNTWGEMDTTIERKRDDVSDKIVARGASGTKVDGEVTESAYQDEITMEEDKTPVKPVVPGTGNKIAADIKSIIVNRQAGLVTVRAYPKDHQEITTFLEQLRSRSQRQVILEAKILEVELNDGFQFGVDWLAINKGLGSSRFPPLFREPHGGKTFRGNLINQRVESSDTEFPTPFTQALILSQSGITSPLSLAFREHDFIGFIDLLQKQGQVQVLSSPRIATINNQKAIIKVGSDELFITGLDSGSVAGSGDAARVSDPTAIFSSMFTGISLDVTPQIGEGDMITLHVHPMVTEVQDREKQFTINGKEQSLPLAWSQTRETDSIIRVRNGEVAVIGGLMKNKSDESQNRLPLLGDIPILGALFGRTEKRWEKSELVILLRPVLVDDRQSWDRHIVRDADRIGGMRNKPPLWWAK